MLAYRLLQAQADPEFQEVPEPHAGPGQVVVRVAGSGLCHTDFTVQSRERSYWKDNAPPFTITCVPFASTLFAPSANVPAFTAVAPV